MTAQTRPGDLSAVPEQTDDELRRESDAISARRSDVILNPGSAHLTNVEVSFLPLLDGADERFVLRMGARLGDSVVGAPAVYLDVATAVRLRDALVDVLGGVA